VRQEGLGIWRVALICAAAYASHLLLDFLAADVSPPFGIQLLWPLSDGWYRAPRTVFLATERRHFLSLATVLTNLKATAWELLVLAPVLGLVWLVREKALTRFSAKPASRHHPS
jgi:hypothetical protein